MVPTWHYGPSTLTRDARNLDKNSSYFYLQADRSGSATRWASSFTNLTAPLTIVEAEPAKTR